MLDRGLLGALAAMGASPARLALRIADISMEMSAGDGAGEGDDLLRVEPAAQPFIDACAAPDIALRVAWGDLDAEAAGELVFDSGSLWRLYRDRGEHVFRFAIESGPYKEARISADLAAGSIRVARACAAAGAPVHPLEYPLDELLIGALLGAGRGVELHACGLVDAGGAGRLFIGESGAGKSTTARLWKNAGCRAVLSDDRIIVRPSGAAFAMHGTPWHGEGRYASPACARLDRVYFLRHGGANRRVPVRGAGAVARLFRCSFAPLYDRGAIAFTLEFLERLAGSVPCEELSFVPAPTAVDAVMRGER